MKRILLTLSAIAALVGGACAQSVVINKFKNATTGLGGSIQDDAIELLVFEDGLDMRGMIIKDFSYNGIIIEDNGCSYTFSNNDIWKCVKAGTIIVLHTNGVASDITTNGTDFNLDIGLDNATYFTKNCGGLVAEHLI